ncbi:D-tyrosyl-tRNA(Tyr) deacylase [Hyphobacterium sp. CCMP332]|nr:D-tyrosyl-tRNA(Tyr) deacylase [Hyphobacterium sp. CCMP332]
MIALIQRVLEAECRIDSKVFSRINKGLLVFIGIEERDSEEDVKWLSNKIVNMRIFSDEEDKMNLSCPDVNGECLLISQFTLHASTKKGNRPSFIKAAKPEKAISLYEKMIIQLNSLGLKTLSGEFGADMKISLINDGPVTIIIDSQNKI